MQVSFIPTAEQTSGIGTIGHPGILITWESGKQFLIDAGMDRQSAIEFGSLMELLFGAEPTRTFGPIEEQLGDAVNSIEGIGFTHLHIDHTQGISALCGAMAEPATIFQTSDQATEQNLHTEEGQALIESSTCRQKLLTQNRINPIEGFPGLFALPAAGHTPGSTIFIVQVTDHTWIFSGDITNDMSSILNDQDKGFLYSYLVVPEDTEKLEKWRDWLKNADAMEHVTVLPAHDINRMENLLNGAPNLNTRIE